MDDRSTRRIETLFRVTSIVILLLSIGLAVLWLSVPGLNLEPALVLLGLLYAAVPLAGRWAVRRLNQDLERERLSMPYALAYGYLTNYLAPVVRQLRKEAADPDRLRFYVYIPRSLDELRGEAIDAILTELQHQQYAVETVELDFPKEKRKKDFRTARRLPDGTAPPKYFDFPTTLLTLEQAVEYKLDTREDRFPFRQREALGQRYIDDFRTQLQAMLGTQRYETIRDNIRIVDGGVDFLERDGRAV
ncbi:MAG: hypothetical protein GVY18_18555 [Bacteroidetes bacterium]|jgi:hypothetical protein|nr:hypothetical protein [Bacteroidota bacterium]